MAGISTGERIPGEKVQDIILRAALGGSINRISRDAGVHYRTAKTLVERESRSIAERKLALQPIFARIAERGALRLERDIDSAPFTAAVIATGVAVDKLIALTPTDAPASQHLHLHLAPQDIAGTFNSFLHNLQAKAHTLPDTPSDSHVVDQPNDQPPSP
jgi:hypothetical protein